jgi:hypothetical protein
MAFSRSTASQPSQPLDSDLTAIAAIANTNSNIIVGNGSAWVAESGDTARISLGVGSTDSPYFTAVNIGAATDTTVTRASAGDINVEGNLVYRAGGTDVPIADGGTGASTLAGANIAVVNVKQDWTAAQVPATQTAAFAQPNFDTYQNFIFTLASGTNALTDPTTESGNVGQTGVFIFIQPSTGAAGTVTMTSQWLPVGGSAPSLSPTNDYVDVVPYMIQAADKVLTGAPQLNFT